MFRSDTKFAVPATLSRGFETGFIKKYVAGTPRLFDRNRSIRKEDTLP